MRNWRKKPRTFNPNEVWGEEKKLCKKASAIENAWLSTVKTLKTDPLEFFRQVLGVEPTDYQKELIELFQKNQFVAARWSRQSGKSHIVMWDLENCTLEEAERTLSKLQRKYRLSHIYVATGVEGSYRAWCFSKVIFSTFLKILVDSLSILDYNFFYYTVKRRKATLRTGTKKGRPAQKVISVLKSYPVPIADSVVEKVVYDTGLKKRGISLLIGGE